jgi:6,7-dimethyl-8-ribityllumazine synthase
MTDTRRKTSGRRGKAHVLVVEARFYDELSDELARGAIKVLEAAGASFERLAVPGALEVPGVIAKAARTRRYDGYVALGAVVRGQTSHYDIVANESARGLMDLAVQGLSIGNGILTCENMEQARTRAHVDMMNKGGAAAEAALRLIEIERTMKNSGKRG